MSIPDLLNSHHNDKSLLLVFCGVGARSALRGSQAIGVDTMPHIAVLKFLSFRGGTLLSNSVPDSPKFLDFLFKTKT